MYVSNIYVDLSGAFADFCVPIRGESIGRTFSFRIESVCKLYSDSVF